MLGKGNNYMTMKMMMKYIFIRLFVAFVSLVVLNVVTYPPMVSANPTQDNKVEDEHSKVQEGEGFCSLSDDPQDGNCQEAVVPNNSADIIDKIHLQNLFEQSMKATQSQDWKEAISIFHQIYKLARTYYDWDKMKMIHYMHGMTLIQLKHPLTALYYFKSAMMLAEIESKKMMDKSKELTMFMQEISRQVMGTGKQVFLEAHQSIIQGSSGSGSGANVDLIYAAIQYAHTVGKLDKANEMIQVLQKIQPNHVGAMLEIGLIANQQNEDEKALQILRQVSKRSNELSIHEASSLWHTLAALECKYEQISHACVDGWYNSFMTEINMTPINRDYIATTAAVNVCNIKLKLLLKEEGNNNNNHSYEEAVEQVAKIGQVATNLGLINSPLQLPQRLIRGISFAPFRDDSIVSKAVHHLEDNFGLIRHEILTADASGMLRSKAALDYEGLHTAGEWKEFNILAHGKINKPAMELLPITTKVVLGLRDASTMVLGGSKVSLMQPGTIVRPHTGQTNARLRIHLGIAIPEGPKLRVGNETRSWTEGKCTVIDDSYVHEVFHHGNERRIVLIVDVWHPEMDDGMRMESLSISSPQQQGLYHKFESDTKAELRRQGVSEELIPSIFISDSE